MRKSYLFVVVVAWLTIAADADFEAKDVLSFWDEEFPSEYRTNRDYRFFSYSNLPVPRSEPVATSRDDFDAWDSYMSFYWSSYSDLNTNHGLAETSDSDLYLLRTDDNFRSGVFRFRQAIILDTGFAAPLQTDGQNYLIGVDGSKRPLVLGVKASPAQRKLFQLSRYRVDPALDTAFGTIGLIQIDFGGMADIPNAMEFQTDSKAVIVGYSVQNGRAQFALARVNTNATLDTSFGSSGKVLSTIGKWANALALSTNGQILVGGMDRKNGAIVMTVARYQTDGTPDTSFNTNGWAAFSNAAFAGIAGTDIALDEMNRPLVAGMTDISGALVRYLTDGRLDTSFNTTGMISQTLNSSSVYYRSHVEINSSGIYFLVDHGARPKIYRFASNGALDTSFATIGSHSTTNSTNVIYDFQLNSKGNLYVLSSHSYSEIGAVVLRANLGNASTYIYGGDPLTFYGAAGAGTNRTVRLRNTGWGQATSIQQGSPALASPLSVDLSACATLNGKSGCTFSVALDTTTAGSYDQTLKINYTAEGNARTLALPVSAVASSAEIYVTCDPLVANQCGEAVTASCTVVNNSASTQTLSGAELYDYTGMQSFATPAYEGGSYPGTSGTCDDPIASAGNCTIVFQYSGGGANLTYNQIVRVADEAGQKVDGVISLQDNVPADADNDGHTTCTDCNDGNATIYPGASENVCNGIDDNCDSSVDEGASDADGDGYKAECDDCNDSDQNVYPGNGC